ncbi:MAG: T9SS type A sorting domain-containing protein, partial [Prevotellaceae bacterium]|nr:T9SS type A sorting domain-containing protein [Prevotellaceae bacterium]
EIQLNLYDRKVTKSVLNNHGESNGKFDFTDRDKILTAKANVVDGTFTLMFMLPKSLNLTAEGGRMSYYASSETAEAYGFFEEFEVGGIGREPDENDQTGPAMTIYLDDPNTFYSGKKVGTTPTFYAELEDINGLNYSGSSSITSIDNDMKIILDNGKEYIVNDYFSVGIDYMRGMVKYTFPPLPAGKHHLKFTARDMLNNSESATFEFEVVEGLDVFNVQAYPNPARTFTTFGIEYNQPDNVAKFAVKVYDLTGRLLYTATQSAVSNGGYDNWTEFPEWSLTSTGGQRLQPGVYLYNAEVTTKSDKTSRSKTQRIIIQ